MTTSNIGPGQVVRLEYQASTGTATLRAVLPDPSFRWSIQTVGYPASFVQISSIVTDCASNIYVAGTIEGTVLFGRIKKVVTTGTLFVAKLNYDGVWQFVTLPDSTTNSNSFGLGAAIDCDNNLYATGSFTGTITLGFSQLTTPLGSTDTWVAKLDPLIGNFFFANQSKAIGTGVTVIPSGLSTDCLGNVYVVGSIGNNSGSAATFATTPITTLKNVGIQELFIARLDPILTWIWANHSEGATTTAITTGAGIALDCQGSVFATGQFAGTVTFATPMFVSTLNTIGATDLLVVRADAGTGLWLDANQSQSDQNSLAVGTAITADCAGNVYVTGHFGAITTTRGLVTFGADTLITAATTSVSQVFVSRLDSYRLGFLFTIMTKSNNPTPDSGFSGGSGITSDCSGNVYVLGAYSGIVTFGDTTLRSPSFTAAFVVKVKPDRSWAGAIQSTASNNTISGSITSNCQGNVYAIGSFAGSIQFGAGPPLRSFALQDGWIVNVVADRSVRLLGSSPVGAITDQLVTPTFVGTPTGNLYSGLVPAFDYFVDARGKLTARCKCEFCSDSDSVYFGTACSTTEILQS